MKPGLIRKRLNKRARNKLTLFLNAAKVEIYEESHDQVLSSPVVTRKYALWNRETNRKYFNKIQIWSSIKVINKIQLDFFCIQIVWILILGGYHTLNKNANLKKWIYLQPSVEIGIEYFFNINYKRKHVTSYAIMVFKLE